MEDFDVGFPDEREDDSNEPDHMDYIEVEHETEKAWLLRHTENVSLWWPKSQCVLRPTYITGPNWLVAEKRRSEAWRGEAGE